MGFTKLFNASSTNYIGWPAGSPLPVPAIQISGTSYFDSLPWVELLLEVMGTLPIEVICIVLPVSLFQNADGPVARYEVAQASNVAVAGITNVGTNILVYLANTTNTIPGTNDSNPLANNMVVYADNLGNRKTATTTVECAYPIHSTQYMSSKGYQLDPSGVNPGGTKTIWFNGGVDPNHPIFDSSAMALVSDIPPFTSDTAPATNKLVVYADGSGNRKSPNAPASSDYPIRATPYMQAGGLLMDDYATNPSGVGTNSIWYSSAIDASRPLFNASRLALLTDIPSLTTDTSPATDNLVVYADSSGNRKTATTDSYISQNLVCNQTSDPVGYLRVRPNSDAGGNIILQSLTGGNLGYSAINFNGYWNGSSDVRFNSAKNRWRMIVDQRNTSDVLSFEAFGTSTTKVLALDSVAGQVQSAWPIAVTTSTNTPLSVTSSNSLCSIAVGSTVASSNRGAIGFGRLGSNKIWEFGSDSTANNTDDAYIYSQSSAKKVQEWTPTSSTIRVPLTVVGTTSTTGVNMSTSASNPGGSNTLWVDSAASTSPSWAGAGRLALASELKTDTNPIANNFVIYTDSSANRGTASGGGVISCANPIGTPAIALFDPGYVADPASSYAGSIWMKTSTDPNRPQFKSEGPMALLSDIVTPSSNYSSTSITISSVTGWTSMSGTLTIKFYKNLTTKVVNFGVYLPAGASATLNNPTSTFNNFVLVPMASIPAAFQPTLGSFHTFASLTDPSEASKPLRTYEVTATGIVLHNANATNWIAGNKLTIARGITFTYLGS